MFSSRAARMLLSTAGLALLAVLIIPVLHQDGTSHPERAAGLRARSAALRNELDLARSGRVFLVLDPQRGTLTLYHGPTPLRAYLVLRVDAGERRLGLKHGRPDWRGAQWDGARLEPRVRRVREVIVSNKVEPPDPAGAVDWIPPTPAEAVPAPSRFVIHFDGGLGLEVVLEGREPDSVRLGALTRALHRIGRLLPRNWDHYRIRVLVPAADGGALYRSLPDGAAFVGVLPW